MTAHRGPSRRRAGRSRSSASGSDSTPSRARMSARCPTSWPCDKQRELEVLRTRPECGQHLLRIGRGEHEHDVRGRFLERLQQRVRRRGREHVHLVDDVHLAPARCSEPEVHALDELAHRVDAVVRRRVELDEVEERSRRDRDAVLACAAGLAVGAEVQAVRARGRAGARWWSCPYRAVPRRGMRARPGRPGPRCAARS